MYCTKCGKEMVNIGLAHYDKDSGKEIYEQRCLIGLCGHDKIIYNKYAKRFEDSIIDHVLVARKCTVCGIEIPEAVVTDW